MTEQQPLAYHDLEFLDSTDARPIRILAEYSNRRDVSVSRISGPSILRSARTLSREGAGTGAGETGHR